MNFSAFPLLVGVFTVLVILYITYLILREGVGKDGMVRIADRIRVGTRAYLNRQLKTIA